MSKQLSVGIVGLPNVGKSTLFNAITQIGVAAENYPFCTIDPTVGIVEVPDDRLDQLAHISNTKTIIRSVIEFVDIAGLVKGASKGEGLGNKFLSNIRSTSVIAHVVRCFKSSDITHVYGDVNPLRDVDIINTELILADIETVEKSIQTIQKKARSGDKELSEKLEVLNKLLSWLSESKPARHFDCSDQDTEWVSELQLITSKKVIYVANVDEADISSSNQMVDSLKAYAQDASDDVVTISSSLEYQLSQLDFDDQKEYLAELGISESGLQQLAMSCFRLLNLQTYLTTGEKETRSWTIKKGMTAPQAAGVIHTDFEKGFIRANIVSYSDFINCRGLKVAKEKGLMRQEGKEYIMQEDDIVEFLFNV